MNQVVSVDYGTVLTKSLLYYEAQRSGNLPRNQRVQWRANSGLKDCSDAQVDLVGGYYDTGDNVKFGFPMAFTITMLSWSTIEFRSQLEAKKELSNALDAIKWGTDYFIKAHPQPDVLYSEVGDGDSDHACRQRPEDMTTPRATFKVDDRNPGSDLAAETAAALATASVAFRPSDAKYADELVAHAKQLFDFARNHNGLHQNSIPVAGKFYSSSGYEDELLWAAAWLERATNNKTCWLRNLSWKANLRVQEQHKSQAEQFICSCIQKGNNNFRKTAAVRSKYLADAKASLQCPGGAVQPSDLINLARSQADYVLGQYPKGMSYMGAMETWFKKDAPNPNVLDGAIVGGPDGNDGYADSRSNFQQAEPATVTIAPFVGVFASLA
ncbi:hypothetical protein Ddye_018400 [Dipteronia dyeriana]|uniref:cellulase n=1 Tax=Dipteronia dyeriana TaxID=168575 RepID=A0AAD9X1F0_9ROSI|nr:hypothetical protein Ddye_018400 [Dipteronia dyeriana]